MLEDNNNRPDLRWLNIIYSWAAPTKTLLLTEGAVWLLEEALLGVLTEDGEGPGVLTEDGEGPGVLTEDGEGLGVLTDDGERDELGVFLCTKLGFSDAEWLPPKCDLVN